MKKRVQGRMEWVEKNDRNDLRKESTCVPARVKGMVYKVAMRPAMLYGLETVALTKSQEAKMDVA